ncbi:MULTISPECIES: DUF2974 domain-containing protein [Lactobacillus]|uniref:DUF2974 domain-containing protein n=1 Tax=Lactobacillus xujianguonis TaxID=2495899 RepID=A0A437SX45_9LACO|nr:MULTISPECIES: DUF2974 domain-containing protein [Lactobacillus]RVU71506.1 DUF2974 domain-containing protein [Lactobacillus xujianguonis]RVU76694.1 DUF2974 domain-containing protein [Lactobacillus xujianguonis]
MANSLEYLRWRGDLSFSEKPFNSVDAALLASLIYLPGDESAVGHTFAEVAEQLRKLPSFQHQMHDETGTEVFLLPHSPRLGNLEILDWTNRLETAPHPLQFTAATFRLTDKTILISYRGTDSTMIGWQEDMVMNYTPEVYGQNVAASYLNRIANDFPNDRIYLVGHSKGGNFAQYALSAVRPEIQDRVIKALNFDGPGFYHKVFTSPGFKLILPKLKTYLPEGSIIGAMLDHPERTLIIKCDASMTDQHDPRRWRVGRDSFVLADGLSTGARIIRHSLIHFNHSIPDAKRGKMFSALFNAFENLDISDVNQLTAHKLLGTYRLSKVLMSLDPELRKIFNTMFTDIWETYRKSNNVPFTSTEYQYQDYPKSSDSKKAPIFFEFYDPDLPDIKLDKKLLEKKKFNGHHFHKK